MIEFLFAGLMTFVTDGAGAIHVLLPNTQDLWRASDTCMVPHHLAFVAVACDELVDAHQCAQEVQNLPASEKPQELTTLPAKTCTWVLDHEDITVEGDLTPAPADDPTRFTAKLVSLEDVVPATGSVQGHDLDPKPDINLLIGRLTLTGKNQNLALQGLSVCQAPVDFYPLRRPLPHYPASPTPPSLIADISYVKTQVTAGIILHLKKFDSMDSGRSIALKQPDSEGSTVVIGDLAIPDTMAENGCGSKLSTVHPAAGSFDRHFEVYYQMTAREPWQDDRLVPFAKCSCYFDPPAQFNELLRLTQSPLPSVYDVYSYICNKGFGERIICPQAVVMPPS